MDSTKYTDEAATGQIKIEEFIDSKYLSQAEDYAQQMRDLTFSGKITRDNRTEEEQEKDLEAIDLLNKLAECDDPALAYGFMLYDETSIVKIYWAKRVGKLRKNKSEFFELDKYLEWLTEIFTTLNGDHPKFHDPLYYFKPGGKSKKGDTVGDYDVMNSFRVHWNMYFLPILAMYLYAEDQKYNDYGISIEDALSDADNAGKNHFEAEISQKANMLSSPEDDAEFSEVEEFLKEFTRFPLNNPIPFKAGTKATGITYRDIMIAIVDGSMKTPTNIRAKFQIGLSIQERIMAKIKKIMDKHGIDIQTLADYISEYRTVALDILNGKDATYREA